MGKWDLIAVSGKWSHSIKTYTAKSLVGLLSSGKYYDLEVLGSGDKKKKNF